MIIPARWMTGGKGLDNFRHETIHDKHFTILHDFANSEDCFTGVDIKGGICYFLWDRENEKLCDKIAGESEKLVLKYSPQWSGAGETVHPIFIPKCYKENFDLVYHEEYRLNVHFTRESWNGRMKACRGVGASLSEEKLDKWEFEHMKMLSEIAPEEFDVKHYAALVELQARK